MGSVKNESLASHLHDSNLRLDQLLDHLARPVGDPVSGTAGVSPQVMEALLSELLCVGQWMRRMPARAEGDLAQQLSMYRQNVEKLRDLLPAIHATLLAEKARLEQERARVEAAAVWAKRSRETL